LYDSIYVLCKSTMTGLLQILFSIRVKKDLFNEMYIVNDEY